MLNTPFKNLFKSSQKKKKTIIINWFILAIIKFLSFLKQQLERELTYERLSEWADSKMMTETLVDLHLPKFSLEDRIDLRDTLRNMGMTTAFTTNADFRGMTDKKDLAISKVIHQSFVAVDEKGTEAAAATAVIISFTTSVINHVLKFKVDHPFHFFIRHNKSKTILFFGRFCCPVE